MIYGEINLVFGHTTMTIPLDKTYQVSEIVGVDAIGWQICGGAIISQVAAVIVPKGIQIVAEITTQAARIQWRAYDPV